MAIISIITAVNYAKSAGFTGTALATIVAIAQAESGLDTTAINPNDPYGGSFGILQINGSHNVPQALAFDPAYAFRFSYTLSKDGTDFSPWSTYTSLAYQQTPAWKQLTGGAGVITGGGGGGGLIKWTANESQSVWPWLFPLGGDRLNPYNPPTENGIDLGMPMHTPITSLTLGTVVSTGYFGGGGVVCVASYVAYAGGNASVYYQHLDTIAVTVGQTVHVGDLIGLSGGQLTGGVHPVTCCSTGPHLEVGINPPALSKLWVNYGPSKNPLPWLNDLATNGPPTRDLIGGVTGTTGGTTPPPNTLAEVIRLSDNVVAGTGPVGDSFFAIEQSIDYTLEFIPLDWTTATQNIHWWDYVLPWQWKYASDTATANLSTAMYHDVIAFLLRGVIMMIGVMLIGGAIFAMIFGGQKSGEKMQQAAQVAQVAEVA